MIPPKFSCPNQYLGPMHAYKAEKDLRYSEQIHQFCITGPNNRGHTVNKVQKKKSRLNILTVNYNCCVTGSDFH